MVKHTEFRFDLGDSIAVRWIRARMKRSWYIGLRYWRPKRPGEVDARKWIGKRSSGSDWTTASN